MPGQASDPTGANILDAALRVLVDFGVKRATVESVAKYASVSHMTVYRRWSGKNELLRAAVLRELSTVLDAAFANAAGSDPDDRVIDAFSNVVWSMRHHPLVVRLSTTEPETFASLLSSTGSGSIMEIAVPLVATRLAVLEVTAGDADDVHALADVFVRMAHSLVVVQDPDNPMATRHNVESYALRCLGPMTGNTSTNAVEPELAAAAPSARRGPLMAASLLAVLLVGAGLGATLVRTGSAPMSPDLIRTEQAPTVSVSSSSSSAVPMSPSSVVDDATVEPPVPPAPAASTSPTFASTEAPPSLPTTIAVQQPSGDGGAPRPSGPPSRTGFSFSPPPPHVPNGPGPRGPGSSPPGPGGNGSGAGPGGGGSGGGPGGGGANHP